MQSLYVVQYMYAYEWMAKEEDKKMLPPPLPRFLPGLHLCTLEHQQQTTLLTRVVRRKASRCW